MDADLIEKCRDPALMPAIVEQFVAVAGSDDPLAITIKADGRLVLIPKPQSTEGALAVVKEYAAHAMVRVGLTQFPAGLGVHDVSHLQATMFEPCENLRTGTALFAKVARIVTQWYGQPTNPELLPQLFDDAVVAWRNGSFEGKNIFKADDPGGQTFFTGEAVTPRSPPFNTSVPETRPLSDDRAPDAGMRVDLSRIQGGRQ